MASNLNDLNKVAVANKNLNDGNLQYFGGGVSPDTLNTTMLRTLRANSVYNGNNLNTAWAQYFLQAAPGLLGTLQDKQKEFWKQGGFPAFSNINIDQMVVWLQSEGWNASNQGGTHLHVADTGESWIQADLNVCNVISAIPALQVDLHQGIEMQGGSCT